VAALRAEVESRARSFGPGVPGVRAASARPPLLLLVDGWEDLCAAAEPFDAGRCADQLLDLMRCCGSAGVTVVLSGDRASLAGRVTGAATRRFLLPLADRADYSAAGVPVAALPAEPPPGRALRVPDGAALQFGFVGAAPDRWGEAVERLASTPGRTNPQAPAPIRIRELPPSVRLAEVRPAAGDPAPRLSLTIGVGGSAATPIVVDLERGARTLLVSGPIRSGRSTVLLSALLQLGARPGVRAAVVASGRSPLRRYAAAEPLPAGSDGAEALLLLIDDCDSLAGTPDEDRVLAQLASPAASVSVVASVRSDRLALSYRGLVAELRQLGSALLLQPTTADAETFGIALPRTRGAPIAGRGILVTDPAWALSESAPRVQVALP
jgi:S-DNA-T family DNA segregation ATPase FtsK/SpoIIIE